MKAIVLDDPFTIESVDPEEEMGYCCSGDPIYCRCNQRIHHQSISNAVIIGGMFTIVIGIVSFFFHSHSR